MRAAVDDLGARDTRSVKLMTRGHGPAPGPYVRRGRGLPRRRNRVPRTPAARHAGPARCTDRLDPAD
ncbi:hypothetical protein ACFYXH_20930 [Streptomyces sp. NPDC002730]|uniref:hypothetical protein n=1 Tax=Streptomyces sp. NPDC002730 TaxID=3364662 RepID=UPI0036CFB9E7